MLMSFITKNDIAAAVSGHLELLPAMSGRSPVEEISVRSHLPFGPHDVGAEVLTYLV